MPATVPAPANGPFSGRLNTVFPALAERFGVRFAIASDPCSLGDLPAAAEKVGQIADLLHEASGPPRFALARDLELIRLITRREGIQGAQRYAEEFLRPLAEHDRANGGALLQTLRAFVGCQAQIRSTAAALSVHENTVRYRLGRIRKVSTIEPERLNALLSVAVALQVEALCGPGDAGPTGEGQPPEATGLRSTDVASGQGTSASQAILGSPSTLRLAGSPWPPGLRDEIRGQTRVTVPHGGGQKDGQDGRASDRRPAAA